MNIYVTEESKWLIVNMSYKREVKLGLRTCTCYWDKCNTEWPKWPIINMSYKREGVRKGYREIGKGEEVGNGGYKRRRNKYISHP